MKRAPFRAWAASAVAALVMPAAAGAQEPPPSALEAVGIDQKLGSQVPAELLFTDSTGKSVRLGDYFGDKPVLLTLVYYECPMLCTLVLNGAVRSLRALQFTAGEEFRVVTVSFDPRETPQLAAEKKKAYLESYGRSAPNDGWVFLTGGQASIDALTEAVGFRYTYDEATQQFAHASGIFVLTPQGKVAQYLLGIEYSARDLRLALIEASRNRLGSLVDQVLLFCFHYNPHTGKYSFAIFRFLQIFGSLTVIVLAGFIFSQLRRERSARATSGA